MVRMSSGRSTRCTADCEEQQKWSANCSGKGICFTQPKSMKSCNSVAEWSETISEQRKQVPQPKRENTKRYLRPSAVALMATVGVVED